MLIHSSKELAEYLRDRRKRQNNPEGTKLETLFKLFSALDLEIQIIPKEEARKPKQGWKEEW